MACCFHKAGISGLLSSWVWAACAECLLLGGTGRVCWAYFEGSSASSSGFGSATCPWDSPKTLRVARDGVGSWGFSVVLSLTGQALGAAQLLYKQL